MSLVHVIMHAARLFESCKVVKGDVVRMCDLAHVASACDNACCKAV
jgi:hypothetical protein